MESLQTVSSVSKNLGISTRMLRFYEQAGLIQSKHVDGYAYRVYDEPAVARLRQIIILRKLRISVKQIGEILNNTDATQLLEVFERNIRDLDEEVTALSTVRSILSRLAQELRDKANVQMRLDWINDSSAIALVDALSYPQNKVQEEKMMENLNQANEKLNQLTDKNVRIVYLPPSDVAAYQYEGDDPEMHVQQVVDAFVRENNLTAVKPDLRHYGFNAPNPIDETNHHGYEMWVTIPEGFPVLAPLVKKHFEGGLYGAHMIPFGAFEEWGWLDQWVRGNEKYEYRGAGDHRDMFGWLEEHLNYVNRVHLPDPEGDGMQLDLLIPIKEKREVEKLCSKQKSIAL